MLKPEDFVSPELQSRMNLESFTDDAKKALMEFAMHMYGLGQHHTGVIEEIKYDGRLIILSDETRWEVESYEASDCEFWLPTSQVVVIDNRMYNIEDAENVGVSPEL